MDLEVERKLIELFVQKDRRERFTDRIGSPKRRKKIWDDLRDTRYSIVDISLLSGVATSTLRRLARGFNVLAWVSASM